ncbi:uncharacterized protein MONOS_18624 [Monocercomonoides exilis]|uniref:uncharacterized protein n=1 Tax=Monocercomonoides exilis TaxID=2049356 RepID=UPI00355A3B02|nr:hypothetical protein MONOS_18624 [Monocercomonoides exilis]
MTIYQQGFYTLSELLFFEMDDTGTVGLPFLIKNDLINMANNNLLNRKCISDRMMEKACFHFIEIIQREKAQESFGIFKTIDEIENTNQIGFQFVGLYQKGNNLFSDCIWSKCWRNAPQRFLRRKVAVIVSKGLIFSSNKRRLDIQNKQNRMTFLFHKEVVPLAIEREFIFLTEMPFASQNCFRFRYQRETKEKQHQRSIQQYIYLQSNRTKSIFHFYFFF